MKHYIYILLLAQAVYGFAQNVATDDYIGFYQKSLSNHKNSRCAMYPSCSRYGQIAFKEYSFIKAISLTCDRIMRCSHDAQYYDITYQYGYRSLADYPQGDTPIQIIHRRFQHPHTESLKWRNDRDSYTLFINKLINKEEYHLALLEIERQLFLKNKDTLLYKQKLLCHRGLKEYEKGIFEYEAEFPTTIKTNANIQMQAALLYYCTNNYDKATSIAKEINTNPTSNFDTQRVNALRGISAAQKGEYEKAIMYFNLNAGNSLLKQQNIDIITRLMEQKKKKPTLARILSIIPGGGYLYTNHKGSALTAFIINSLLGYATYTSIKNNNYGIAGVCGFLSLSFYIGNINGAGRSANRYNQKKKNEQIKRLEKINNIFIN